MILSKLFSFSACAALCAAMAASVASAATIEIEFTGLDLSYDGSTISATADPLSSVTVEEDNVPVAGSPFGASIFADLSIPGVTDIAVGGDTVVSSAGGTLGLDLPGGDSVDLTLGEVTVSYVDLGFVQFSFGGSVGSVDSQSLPAGLILGSPVSVSFSAPITSLSDDGTNLLSFTADGTGQIEGPSIPEPTAAVLAALAAAGFVARRR